MKYKLVYACVNCVMCTMVFRGVQRRHSGKVHVTRISDRVKEDLDGAKLNMVLVNVKLVGENLACVLWCIGE